MGFPFMRCDEPQHLCRISCLTWSVNANGVAVPRDEASLTDPMSMWVGWAGDDGVSLSLAVRGRILFLAELTEQPQFLACLSLLMSLSRGVISWWDILAPRFV